MALPIHPVSRPTVLSGQSNGQLDTTILVATPGLAGGPTVRLVAPAARAWRAMCAAAQADGIVLQATSVVDSYRPYSVQFAVFHDRYTTQRNTDWDIKVCDGVTYYQRPGTASAACPGTSNHGWGLAVDVAGASGRRLDWLVANAWRFGFSWELPSEPWHIRYCTGDAVPAAVLAFEEGSDMDAAQDAKLTDCLNILTAMAAGRDTVAVHDKDGQLDLRPFYHRVAAEVGVLNPGSAHTHDVVAVDVSVGGTIGLSGSGSGATGPAKPTA